MHYIRGHIHALICGVWTWIFFNFSIDFLHFNLQVYCEINDSTENGCLPIKYVWEGKKFRAQIFPQQKSRKMRKRFFFNIVALLICLLVNKEGKRENCEIKGGKNLISNTLMISKLKISAQLRDVIKKVPYCLKSSWRKKKECKFPHMRSFIHCNILGCCLMWKIWNFTEWWKWGTNQNGEDFILKSGKP